MITILPLFLIAYNIVQVNSNWEWRFFIFQVNESGMTILRLVGGAGGVEVMLMPTLNHTTFRVRLRNSQAQ